MQTTFSCADKSQLDRILPQLFRILHGSMTAIAPTGDSYEEDLALWLENIIPAMEREQRQMVLMTCSGELAGYFQYNIIDTMWMMEEIQLKPEYQGTGLFRPLYAWLRPRLPGGLTTVEAYAHKNNEKSQGILEHLGLKRIGENPSGSCWHYQGSCRELWEKIG